MRLPFNPAADHNKDAILAGIAPRLAGVRHVLEIGSGSGQHAVHFAAHLPHLLWQTSDLPAAHAEILAWIEDAGVDNVLPPLTLDVSRAPWPVSSADAVYSSNTVHCMSWPAVAALFAGVAGLLPDGGAFLLYGPFNYHSEFVSEGNRRLHAWVQTLDPDYGLRDVDDLRRLADRNGLGLCDDQAMPANNRLLTWIRR